MKLHRFIGGFDFTNKFIKISDQELLNQLRNVLRLKIGETIILNNGADNDALAIIRDSNKEFIEIEILEINKNQNEPQKEARLFCSILKKENFELVVQKATEVGVKQITPIICKRTIKLNLREDRLEKIIKEAAEQSSRGIIPILKATINFENAVKDLNNNGILFDKSGERFNPLNLTSKIQNIFIGPEGGWDTSELELARSLKFKIVSLSSLTFRAETAAIVASYLSTID